MAQMMNICMVKLIWSKEGEINSKRAWEEHHGLDMENMLGKTSTKSEIKYLELDINKRKGKEKAILHNCGPILFNHDDKPSRV